MDAQAQQYLPVVAWILEEAKGWQAAMKTNEECDRISWSLFEAPPCVDSDFLLIPFLQRGWFLFSCLFCHQCQVVRPDLAISCCRRRGRCRRLEAGEMAGALVKLELQTRTTLRSALATESP